MGAELLIHSIGFKSKDRCLIDEKWARKAFARAKRSIDAIDPAQLIEINEGQDNPFDDVKSCKRQLLKDLAEVRDAAFGHHRQAGMVLGGDGILLLLAGGLSWGDSPGELFDAMSRLLAANVLCDARWTDADQPKDPTKGEEEI